ncbi:unnamed protein product, partial [Heterosigma akashiwo]
MPDVPLGSPKSIAYYTFFLFVLLWICVFGVAPLAGPGSQYLSAIVFVASALVFSVLPSGSTFRAHCWYVARVLYFVFLPGSEVYFVEVFVADALTSISKVLADMGHLFWVVTIYSAQIQSRAQPILVGGSFSHQLFRCLFASLPYFLRARQCSIARRGEQNKAKRRTHLLNHLKYLSAFPVIWTPVFQAALPPAHSQWIGAVGRAAALLNTLYSLYWDIVCDWGLTSWGKGRPITLCPGGPAAYRLAAALDAALRFAWLLKLPGAARAPPLCPGGGGGAPCWLAAAVDAPLTFQVLEAARRALWFVLRVEWECLASHLEKGGGAAAAAAAPVALPWLG